MPNLNPNSTNYTHSFEPNNNDLAHAMTYDPYGAPVLRIDDTTKQHTSKNRVKVSTYEVTDFTTFATGINADQWDQAITGTASATFDPYLGMARLQVGSSVGDSIIRQTTRVQRYIPGRQAEVSMTAIFGTPTIGVRRRFGLFDELNGFYFEDSGNGSYACVLRRNSADGVVDEDRFARVDWNVDKLDGTGASGIVVDPMAIQHMCLEYEWYGAGMIEWNFIINNNKYPIHRIFHANVHDHTWAASAALPVRIELTNTGGAAGTHTFHQGSHSVSVDGTTTLLGRQKSISSAVTGKNLNAANTFTPVVAIRLKSTALDGVVVPDEYAAATLDNTNIFVRVIENAVVTGGTWVSYSPESAVEYNITATEFSGGTPLSTIYVSSGNLGSLYSFPERTVTQINRTTTTNLADTSGNFLIAVASTQSNKLGWASLGWIEVR